MSTQQQEYQSKKKDQSHDLANILKNKEKELKKISDTCEKLEKEKGLLVEKCRELQIELLNIKNQHKKALETNIDKAMGKLVKKLLPTFDNLNRARHYKQITGILESIVIAFEETFKAEGLASFGEVGDKFDPNFYEAVSFKENDEAKEKDKKEIQVCAEIVEKGYLFKGVLLRSAKVVVEIK